MSVVDAGVVVAALTEVAGRGAEARERLRRARVIHAPHLIDLEVGSALRGLVRGRKLHHEKGFDALVLLRAMPLRRYPHFPLLARVWELRSSLTPYDAAYVALAERLSLPLLTTDVRLDASPGLACEVRVLRG
ncbi:MAG: type II toxin-antitoxin system VapC family toxin [Actinomycetes bacterium]